VHTNEFMPLAWAETERAGGNNLLASTVHNRFPKANILLPLCPGERRVERTHRPN
jgi:hypothetical protein